MWNPHGALYGQGPNGKIEKQGAAQGYPAGQGPSHYFILLYIRMTIKIQTGSLQFKNIVSVKPASYFIVKARDGHAYTHFTYFSNTLIITTVLS